MIRIPNLWNKKEYSGVCVHTRLLQTARRKYPVIGITRVRNEELILADTLSHVSQFVDAIIAYDDCSTDSTLSILKKSKSVIQIIENKHWDLDRVQQETEHRQILLDAAREFTPEWLFYFDADERFDLSRKIFRYLPAGVDGVKIRLFDAYMTEDDRGDYVKGMSLWNFRRFFGPEYRDILMIFRNVDYICFEGLDAREPVGCREIVTQNYCQHYGKGLSIKQWEETCDYYSTYFPEPYCTKWRQRRGKAIHTHSDFGRELYTWDIVKRKGIPI